VEEEDGVGEGRRGGKGVGVEGLIQAHHPSFIIIRFNKTN